MQYYCLCLFSEMLSISNSEGHEKSTWQSHITLFTRYLLFYFQCQTLVLTVQLFIEGEFLIFCLLFINSCNLSLFYAVVCMIQNHSSFDPIKKLMGRMAQKIICTGSLIKSKIQLVITKLTVRFIHLSRAEWKVN